MPIPIQTGKKPKKEVTNPNSDMYNDFKRREKHNGNSCRFAKSPHFQYDTADDDNAEVGNDINQPVHRVSA